MSDGMVVENLSDIDVTGEYLRCANLVLIVDDNEQILDIAAETLKMLAYNIIAARNGLEAAAVLRTDLPVSILFTDLQMPGVGREELALIAEASRPDIRVIFTSGCSQPRGNARFLRKPYKVFELVEVFSQQPTQAMKASPGLPGTEGSTFHQR